MRQIANHFNKYFTNVGSQVDEIDTSNKQPFTSYLGPPCYSVFSFEYTTSDRVVKIIEKSKPKTNSGPDGQSSKLLKAVGNTLAPTLIIIINQSLHSGIFPDRLNISTVLPLYKKRNKLANGKSSTIFIIINIIEIIWTSCVWTTIWTLKI